MRWLLYIGILYIYTHAGEKKSSPLEKKCYANARGRRHGFSRRLEWASPKLSLRGCDKVRPGCDGNRCEWGNAGSALLRISDAATAEKWTLGKFKKFTDVGRAFELGHSYLDLCPLGNTGVRLLRGYNAVFHSRWYFIWKKFLETFSPHERLQFLCSRDYPVGVLLKKNIIGC